MSNTISHTPEPWESCEQMHGNEIFILDDDLQTIATLEPARHGDARRIVACVNACAGITTEALKLVAQESGNIFAGMHRIEKENAALRAALEQERELRRIAEFENESNIQDK